MSWSKERINILIILKECNRIKFDISVICCLHITNFLMQVNRKENPFVLSEHYLTLFHNQTCLIYMLILLFEIPFRYARYLKTKNYIQTIVTISKGVNYAYLASWTSSKSIKIYFEEYNDRFTVPVKTEIKNIQSETNDPYTYLKE